MLSLIRYGDYNPMIIYEDIRKAAIESNKKTMDLMHRFREIIEHFILAYENSLEIAENRDFINSSGNKERIVTLGVEEQDNFVEISCNSLQLSQDFKMHFCIKTIVNYFSFDAPYVTIKCVLFREDGNNFLEMFFSEKKSSKVCRIPDRNSLDVYHDACEAQKTIVLNTIKSSSPL